MKTSPASKWIIASSCLAYETIKLFDFDHDGFVKSFVLPIV
jgi:hypothetical protein